VNGDCILLDFSSGSMEKKTYKSVKKVTACSTNYWVKNLIVLGTKNGKICFVDIKNDEVFFEKTIKNCEKTVVNNIEWVHLNHLIISILLPPGFDFYTDNNSIENQDLEEKYFPHIINLNIDFPNGELKVNQAQYTSQFIHEEDCINLKLYCYYFSEWNISLYCYGSDTKVLPLKFINHNKEENNEKKWKILELPEDQSIETFPI